MHINALMYLHDTIYALYLSSQMKFLYDILRWNKSATKLFISQYYAVIHVQLFVS